MISTIPIALPDITQFEKEAVQKVMDSRMIASGEKVNEFEKRFANFIGVKHAVAVNSGTAALHCAYLASNLENNAITTPLTFNATINMLKVSKLSPKYADIGNDFNIDVDKIRMRMNSYDELIVPLFITCSFYYFY